MKTIPGDLIKMALNGEFDIIVHGCNCWITMGGGIAKTIRETFPEAFDADKKTLKGDYDKLGTISVASNLSLQNSLASNITVINAYTQYKYWYDKDQDPNTPLVNYDAVRKAFRQIKNSYGNQNLRFGIPKIGAGLANGDWKTISAIIDAEMEGEDLTLVEFVP